MKKTIIILIAAFIVTISAFTIRKNLVSGIHGTISPAGGAQLVWAVGIKDSVSAVPVSGNFSINTKPGKWRIHVIAVASYKDAFVDNIIVEDGQYTDVGEIKLIGGKQ